MDISYENRKIKGDTEEFNKAGFYLNCGDFNLTYIT